MEIRRKLPNGGNECEDNLFKLCIPCLYIMKDLIDVMNWFLDPSFLRARIELVIVGETAK